MRQFGKENEKEHGGGKKNLKSEKQCIVGRRGKKEFIRRTKRSIQIFSEVQSNCNISHLHTRAGAQLNYNPIFFSYLTTQKIDLNIYILALKWLDDFSN